MKIIDIASKLSVLLILFILIVILNKLINLDTKESHFYEYNNSKINLKQVKKITPRIEYILTYKEDNDVDVFRKYSTPLNPEEIQNIEKFLYLAEKSDFYDVEITSFMLFDNAKIVLYHSPLFLKSPATYSVNEGMLSKLSSYGLDKEQYDNLKQIQKNVYSDAQKFFDDVVNYAKIKRTDWSKKNIPKLGMGDNAQTFMAKVDTDAKEKELKDADIKNIVQKLNESYKQYVGLE